MGGKSDTETAENPVNLNKKTTKKQLKKKKKAFWRLQTEPRFLEQKREANRTFDSGNTSVKPCVGQKQTTREVPHFKEELSGFYIMDGIKKGLQAATIVSCIWSKTEPSSSS